jgi:hypothetical protein
MAVKEIQCQDMYCVTYSEYEVLGSSVHGTESQSFIERSGLRHQVPQLELAVFQGLVPLI